MSDDNGPQMRVVDNPGSKRFEGFLGDDLVAVIEYIPMDGKVIATHTEVAPSHEGQGIGSQMVAATLELLRADGRLVQPLCPYVTSYLRRHPEYADVVDTSTPH